jgi:hypothetical protein
LQDFLASIQGSYGQASTIFSHALSALEPALSLWFGAIAEDWLSFVIPSCPFLPTYDASYPDLASGDHPDTILDHEAFLPILDKLGGWLRIEG